MSVGVRKIVARSLGNFECRQRPTCATRNPMRRMLYKILSVLICCLTEISRAQVLRTSGAHFFHVDAFGDAPTERHRFTNDSLLAISLPPPTSAVQSYADGTRREKRQWGAMALPSMAAPLGAPLTTYMQRMYNVGAYAASPNAMFGGNGAASYCPTNCAPCSYTQCRGYQLRCVPTTMNCCCAPASPAASVAIAASAPYKYDLKDSCDGEEAVAGCINGLCGQGYVCTGRRFCCRCATGRSIGNCVNGLCPQGYACNDNNFCCTTSGGAGGAIIIGKCVNGRCPQGFVCEADNYCHAAMSSLVGNNVTASSFYSPAIGGVTARSAPVILGKCVNGRCPVGYTCGVGNLCYSSARVTGFASAAPYVLGRCERGQCPLGYTCGADDFCYSNNMPVARIGARPEVLGRCEAGLCPSGYRCGSDDFCHRNADMTPRGRRPLSPTRKSAPVRRDADEEDSKGGEDSRDESLDEENSVEGNELQNYAESRRRRARELENYKLSAKHRPQSWAWRKKLQSLPYTRAQRERVSSRADKAHRQRRQKLNRREHHAGDADNFIRTNQIDDLVLYDFYAIPNATSAIPASRLTLIH